MLMNKPQFAVEKDAMDAIFHVNVAFRVCLDLFQNDIGGIGCNCLIVFSCKYKCGVVDQMKSSSEMALKFIKLNHGSG